MEGGRSGPQSFPSQCPVSPRATETAPAGPQHEQARPLLQPPGAQSCRRGSGGGGGGPGHVSQPGGRTSASTRAREMVEANWVGRCPAHSPSGPGPGASLKHLRTAALRVGTGQPVAKGTCWFQEASSWPSAAPSPAQDTLWLGRLPGIPRPQDDEDTHPDLVCPAGSWCPGGHNPPATWPAGLQGPRGGRTAGIPAPPPWAGDIVWAPRWGHVSRAHLQTPAQTPPCPLQAQTTVMGSTVAPKGYVHALTPQIWE